MTFHDLNINNQLFNALDDLGFTIPTPIQSEAFNVVASGKDMVGIAQTGTGKTFAYMLPILKNLKFSQQENPRVLVLVPTRELVVQVVDEIERLGLIKNISLKNHVLHGDIWEILARHKIGVIPFNDNPLTRYATPTKLFEFMAAGCQIVCPDLSPMRRYDVTGANFFIPGDIVSLGNSIINAIKKVSNKNILKNQLKRAQRTKKKKIQKSLITHKTFL